MKTLNEIAEENSLEITETTSQSNGYPSNLQYAIIGLENFEQAEDLANKHNLTITTLHKKDGWNLWARTGGRTNEAFTNSAEDFGDNYSEFNGGEISEEVFLDDEVSPRLADFETFQDLEEFIKDKKEVYSEIEKAVLNEIVITFEGRYYETIQKESMYFFHDTNHYSIALIEDK